MKITFENTINKLELNFEEQKQYEELETILQKFLISIGKSKTCRIKKGFNLDTKCNTVKIITNESKSVFEYGKLLTINPVLKQIKLIQGVMIGINYIDEYLGKVIITMDNKEYDIDYLLVILNLSDGTMKLGNWDITYNKLRGFLILSNEKIKQMTD